VKTTGQAGRKLEEQLLLARRVEGDRLMLADAILLAALDASRSLTAGEQAALRDSPLTMRRFRTLSLERTRAAWRGSSGMLRAASSGPVTALNTDDGHWSLHFLEQEGSWRVILALDAGAPFAGRLLREQPLLRVLDGGGAIVLQGSLDADGECETLWPFETAPGPHFQQFGALFAVEPVHP
jgi:hypothetical protein